MQSRVQFRSKPRFNNYKKYNNFGLVTKYYNYAGGNIYCTNCGKVGHEYKHCDDAIISMGVILLRFDYDKIRELFFGLIGENGEHGGMDAKDVNGIKIESISDIDVFSTLRENIKFLMIRRKHTLGYIEFIRGRYKPDNVDGIVFLFQQMTREEIDRIGRMDIGELWNDFWIDPDKRILYEKEFCKTKQKFDKLKNGDDTELTLDFYVKHVVPTWDQAEWGFPKGRRNKTETNVRCALREFEEETGLNGEDYILLEGIKPLVEEFIGTNGVRYKHIYYVAYANSDVMPVIDVSNMHQATEIGDIGYYTYNDVINMIRPYHVERKKIITKLYMYLLEKIIIDLRVLAVDEQEEVNVSVIEAAKD
ncbi:MAG: NUDIX hydrolase [Hyperionvirus sp.]|uniref:NUDIX hydrolase n=1 Tax=Hyperionvirus sp. TaxID=2487770 RepID=A0A3G5ABD2_9VIRU|nr:MAG: NUDIX hydrolase [Hyperionvirus sp.]